jgi:predicted transcriptional regulator
MSRTVTLRLDDPVYRMFSTLAERENRPLSNFIETSVIRFIEEHHLVDEFESEEIRGNRELRRSLKRGVDDAKRRRGVFV